jgi:hypothetical protein
VSSPSELLQSALDEYRRLEAALLQQRSKAERSQRESQSAIDDHEISEGVASTKLALAQVLAARVRARELELTRSLNEFGKATVQACQQLNSAVRDAWGKRRDLIGRRGCEAMSIPLKSLELGELDTVLSLSEPLNAIRVFEVPIYSPHYVETVTQKEVQFVTTNIGDFEVLEPLTTDREPVISQTLDVEHLITSAEQIIKNYSGLEKEMERTI